jgi:hypothetical protein
MTLLNATSLALVGIGTLLLLLVQKEIVLSSQKQWSARVAQALNIGIVPLLVVLAMTVVMKFANVLG